MYTLLKIIITISSGPIIGFALCLAATFNRHSDSFSIFSLNADYTTLGWILRILGGMIGMTCLVSAANFMPKLNKQTRRLLMLCGFILVMWEFAVIAFVIAFLTMIIMGFNA